jgi:hypothetical protein
VPVARSGGQDLVQLQAAVRCQTYELGAIGQLEVACFEDADKAPATKK